jgi:7,8-dihydropterin-6-yl-methyl-4-(beta-D-ribofuranosyl)aminobenzene 5'-phosphate synthase
MRITILTENVAGGKFLAEHGISYFIEIDDQKILFDTGHSDVFLKNARQLGIDIENEVEKVVLSHGHWDHGDGLKHLQNKTLITHPDAFIHRFRKRDLSPVGLSIGKKTLQKNFSITESRGPLQITDHLWYLGEIPRNNDFEAQSTSFVDDFQHDDFIPDDTAMAAVVKNRLIVITGCSHSGICNITTYAKKITGISDVRTVLGGFHLKQNDEQTRKTIEYFKNEKVDKIYPSHCTELPAMAAFHAAFGNPQLKTGMVLEFQ